jgi:hypothetical protein
MTDRQSTKAEVGVRADAGVGRPTTVVVVFPRSYTLERRRPVGS